MKKLSILSVILFTGCALRYQPAFDYEFDIPDLGLDSVEDVCVWTADFVRYVDDNVHEVSEYWQTPYQTYTWLAGDCEDFAILAMYLIYRDTGLIPCLVCGTDRQLKSAHGWIRMDGKDWEPQTGYQCDYSGVFPFQTTIPYEEVLWRAVNRHKKIQ
jgi:hypothetical protein